MVNWVALSVFIFFFLAVTIIGFVAARWRRGDLHDIDEWGLAGRRFGTLVTWFLLGGDLYTAYTFVAVPGSVFASGALGFFAVPYTILVYPIIFVLMPKFWTVCKQRGYVTAADFVKDRFGSRSLGLAVAFTGILATLPYIALQMFGIQISLTALGIPNYTFMGVNLDIPLFIAFLILAAYTYTSGLRAPAMIAMVKDIMIILVIIVIIIYAPLHMGGFGAIFAKASVRTQGTKAFHELLTAPNMLAYSTLAFGSALALFLYPHSLTSTLSSNSKDVVKRNTALLPIYSLVLGLIALLGFVALALPKLPGNSNAAIPQLITQLFPDWFIGFAFAAISIGALVPAAVMSIASANLFTRNIYKEYFRPNCSMREESEVAKVASFLLKFGALLFIVFVPTTNIIQFQLLGGVWILQTLIPVFIGLYSNWFNRWAMLVGWAVGMITGTLMAFSGLISGSSKALVSSYALPFSLGGVQIIIYAGLAAFVLNIIISAVLTPLFQLFPGAAGTDATSPSDYDLSRAPTEPKESPKTALG
jgi:SSS family solute:Na+ symporter